VTMPLSPRRATRVRRGRPAPQEERACDQNSGSQAVGAARPVSEAMSGCGRHYASEAAPKPPQPRDNVSFEALVRSEPNRHGPSRANGRARKPSGGNSLSAREPTPARSRRTTHYTVLVHRERHRLRLHSARRHDYLHSRRSRPPSALALTHFGALGVLSEGGGSTCSSKVATQPGGRRRSALARRDDGPCLPRGAQPNASSCPTDDHHFVAFWVGDPPAIL
jgi:hypothetical protein